MLAIPHPRAPSDPPAHNDADADADADPFRRWARRVTATMPPMTDEEITSTAELMRRIDARRTARHR